MVVLTSPSPAGIIAISAVFWVLQAVAIFARFWFRYKERVTFGPDDWLALAASLSYTAIFTVPVIIGAAVAGLGTHAQPGPGGLPSLPSQTFNNIQFMFLTFHVFVLGFARGSVLCLYHRVFLGRAFLIVFWSMLAFTIAWTLSFFLAFLLHCVPVTITTLPPPGASCVNLVDVTEALGVTSFLSDVAIMVMPWPFMLKLQLRASVRNALLFVFMLGSATLAFSLVRCIMLYEIAYEIEKGVPDFTYFDGITIIWAELESAMAITCSCLLTLGGVLRTDFSKIFRSIGSSVRRLYLSFSRTASRSGRSTEQGGASGISAVYGEGGAAALTDSSRERMYSLSKGLQRDQIGVRRDIDTEIEMV